MRLRGCSRLSSNRASTDMPQIALGELRIDVTYKDIKNVHLSVYPPNGSVRISAPLRLDLTTIRIFAISRLNWIRKQQAKLTAQTREPARDFVGRESHYHFGQRYLLKITEVEAPPKVVLKHSTIEMQVRPGTPREKRETILDEWYRQRLKEVVPRIILRWEKAIGVDVKAFGIKKMKTKWGSCNPGAGRIWLNLELAKRPVSCIEYVTVHEMVHLLERKHGERFRARMDEILPMWRYHREELNKGPLSHQSWSD